MSANCRSEPRAQRVFERSQRSRPQPLTPAAAACVRGSDERRSTKLSHGPLLALLVVGGAAYSWLAAAPPDAPAPPARDELALASCSACHSGKNGTGYKRFNGAEVEKYICLDEFTKWEGFDPHAKAGAHFLAALDGELGTRMSRRLGYEVKADARCKACHATELTPLTVPKEKKDFSSFGQGINCFACHGRPVSDEKNWVGQHFQKDWREKRADVKTQYGLTDLREPGVRAETCVSCHVGNLKEGKFITHEMYAAGHPPLPAFEVAAFSEFQPRHWHRPGDNEYFKTQSADECEKRFHRRPDENAEARLVATGAVIEFRAAMRLLADDPTTDVRLDLANFDCYSCHHDLRRPTYRQERVVGVPGRPMMRAAPAQLVRMILGTDRRAEFKQLRDALQSAFDERPFGDPAKVRDAATNLVTWSDGAITDLDGVKFKATEVARIRQEIAAYLGGDKNHPDFGAAQQLAWAFQMIGGETKLDSAREALLGLRLRDSDKAPVPVLELLPARMKTLYDYEPRRLRPLFPAQGASGGLGNGTNRDR